DERRQGGRDVQERTPNVQAVAARSREQPRRRAVDEDAGAREREHEPAMDIRRRDEPPYRLEDDPAPDERERDPVRQRCEDLAAPEAERPASARRASRERGRDERERKGGRVGEHVPSVGEKRERARREPDDDLGDEQPDD